MNSPISEEVYNVLNEEYKSFENYFSKLNDFKKNNVRLQFSDSDFKN